ncbi:GNAT family N-acetyltransferase [Rhodococcus globerulus]|uniref:GNAT family N-acetyltransferase n=1 Tax=Rhodococcus globerulus TaxID=33008 RepID=A0ABU4BSY3_RHOGO|nr:GNAT family N-acetyltransferase [Rhodococcus globerulus]MDV6267340.1 GNAT family N-acetyltransferase [Rhodococcus globerulus]
MIEIREILPNEFDTVGELTVQAYVGGGFVAEGTPYAERLRDTATRAQDGRVLVAVLSDRVVGSLTVAEPGTPFADVAQAGELEFRMLAVSPDARGSGAGTALVRAVIAEAYDRGDHSVVMSTQPEMVDARRIYDRNGFVPDPDRAWEPIRGMELTVLVRDLA